MTSTKRKSAFRLIKRVDAEDLRHYQAYSGNVERGHRAAISSGQ